MLKFDLEKGLAQRTLLGLMTAVSLAALTACGGGEQAATTAHEPGQSLEAAAALPDAEQVLHDALDEGETLVPGIQALEDATGMDVASAAGGRESAKALTPVASTDVVARTDSRQSFANQTWFVNCDTAKTRISNIAEPGVYGAALEDGSRLKLGVVKNPNGNGENVLTFRSNQRNILQGGAPRCEGAFDQTQSRIQKRTVMWQAFNIWIDDWSMTTKGDNQLVAQWWPGDPNANVNPVFALYVQRNWLSGVVRNDPNAVPSKATSLAHTVFQKQGGFYKRWMTVAVQTVVSQNAADKPFMKIWLDGTLVGSYQGPIGYNLSTLPVPKFGVYKYHGTNWDMVKPTREIYLKDFVVVHDAARRYTVEDILAQIRR